METCSSPGTGTVTLLGAVATYQRFFTKIPTGTALVPYRIADQSGPNFEEGIATYTASTNQLTRTAANVVDGTNGVGTLVNFATGTQLVMIVQLARYSVMGLSGDGSGTVIVGGTANYPTVGLPTTGVTAGSYTTANITVDSFGIITAAASGSAGVTSVTNSDGSLTFSPTTGGVVGSLNTANANTWTATQTIVVPATTGAEETSLAIAMANGTPLVKFLHYYDPSGEDGYNTINFYNNKTGGLFASFGFIDGYASLTFSNNVSILGSAFVNGTLQIGAYATSYFSGPISSYANQNLVLSPQSGYSTVVSSSGTSVASLIVKAEAGQTADLQQWENSSGMVDSQIDCLGAWHPPSIADSSAQNNSLYYSTTQSALVYKDSAGSVHVLS